MLDIAGSLAEQIGTKLYKTPIRNSVKVREAQFMKQDLFTYAGKSNPAADYEAFTDELLQDLKGGN